ncbi:MAG: hypothetical protein M3282_10320 [Gemmatimonadota bacterium]|nr:hypothetical protein [Gemmatimonadota bacterium]
MTHDGTDDKDFDQVLAEMRRSYDAPRPPPLDEMWARIEGEWLGARSARVRAEGGWVGARGVWWIGLAAALVVGVGIGRLTSPWPRLVATADLPRTTDRAPRTAADITASYDQTTARYLGQTAALLIALPGEARAGRTDQRFVARAAELLTTTRLLLDSPAAADPKVRALLEDVELVLAQVAHLESDRGRVEFELIAQALEQRDLLPRLTSAAAGGGKADD